MALKFLREDYSAIQDEDLIRVKSITKWFGENLSKPDKFSNATNKNPEKYIFVMVQRFRERAYKENA